MTAKQALRTIRAMGDPEIAAHSQRFFKTGKGEYGEGDRFLGVRVPRLRALVKEYRDMSQQGVLTLLHSPWHEVRLFALLLWGSQFQKGDAETRRLIYGSYLENTTFINNWDLVDCSAHVIVGAYLMPQGRKPLYRLIKSENIWERRIALIATYHFIRHNEFEDTLALCERVLNDREDLIHKASGWMLREVAKRDETPVEEFLQRHYHRMPRTMLRYALEKFPKARREAYLKGRV